MPSAKRELTRDEITELLTELGSRLQATGVEATLYIVGGAAIALEFDARRVTTDIDAVFHPEATVRREARRIAEERGLPQGWLNNSVASFVPRDDSEAIPFEVPGLAVALASPRHLLAMKMIAFRPIDRRDLEILFRELRVTSPDQAADIAMEVYGDHFAVPAREELVLTATAVLARMKRAPRTRRRE